MSGVRLDKWLWAARFFKTRTLAAKACEQNRARVDGQTAKSSREVRVGSLLRVQTETSVFEIEVLGLSDMRGPAAVAQTLYRETDESRTKREPLQEQRRAMPTFEVVHEGKPGKRDRRRFDDLRQR